MTDIKTKSQIVADDVAALLRARNPLLWIVTREESRVERYLFEAAALANYKPHFWDVAQGFTELGGEQTAGTSAVERDPGEALTAIADAARGVRDRGRSLWIMRDLPAWLNGPGGVTTLRQLRNLARMLPGVARERAQAIVVISPNGDVPAELSNHAALIDWPLPDRAEIAARLDTVLAALPDELRDKAAPNGSRDAAIDAAVGLSDDEAASCYAKSLVQTRTIDAAAVAQEKRRVIARERVLEWFDPLPGGLDAVGGLDVLKSWLQARRAAYSRKAREYGLPAPKGVLLVGVPGCGKSLTAKAIATAWGVPLLRVDLGALKSKFVGESEANLRKAFNVIAALGRCVVWLDEIEKALAGATQGAADGGVSSDALGAILSWMQDRQGEAFVIATANNVEALPPELLRKGRFDELFFVDLPTQTERAQIVAATLKTYKQNTEAHAVIDMRAVAQACAGFTGSEIAALVPDAMFNAFADNERTITTADLIAAAGTVTPLSKTAEQKISALREWSKGRARPATTPEVQARGPVVRALDL
jgi:MoxR-like ATPase